MSKGSGIARYPLLITLRLAEPIPSAARTTLHWSSIVPVGQDEMTQYKKVLEAYRKLTEGVLPAPTEDEIWNSIRGSLNMNRGGMISNEEFEQIKQACGDT